MRVRQPSLCLEGLTLHAQCASSANPLLLSLQARVWCHSASTNGTSKQWQKVIKAIAISTMWQLRNVACLCMCFMCESTSTPSHRHPITKALKQTGRMYRPESLSPSPHLDNVIGKIRRHTVLELSAPSTWMAMDAFADRKVAKRTQQPNSLWAVWADCLLHLRKEGFLPLRSAPSIPGFSIRVTRRRRSLQRC